MGHKIAVVAAPFIVLLFWLFTYRFWAYIIPHKNFQIFRHAFWLSYSTIIIVICLVCPLLI